VETQLSRQRLDVARAYRELADVRSGGVVVFVGRVRPDRSGRSVVRALWYEADERMARPQLRSLVGEAKRLHGARKVVLWHRLGAIPVGGVSVIVGAAAGHRAEAFRAARFLIEGVKRTVPIWKTDRTATERRPAPSKSPGRRRPRPA
jgi:molybdopterin synthase catalytic subunit